MRLKLAFFLVVSVLTASFPASPTGTQPVLQRI